jgi:ATP-dependent Lhr-like helicase
MHTERLRPFPSGAEKRPAGPASFRLALDRHAGVADEEARGEIRGGRFVDCVSGEQYAGSEALPAVRAAASGSDNLILPATDPLNLSGRVGAAARIPAVARSYFRIVGGEFTPASEAPRFDPLIVPGSPERLTALPLSKRFGT